MPPPTRSMFGLYPLRSIPVTATLAALLLAASLVGAVLERNWGLGTSLLVFRPTAVLELELWRLVTYPLVESNFLGLVLSALILWIFGGWFESTYGRRDTLRFFWLSAICAALLALPLAWLVNLALPFYDPGVAQGPTPVLNAMLVAFALAQPNATVLFGFVLPVRARTIVFLILGIQVVSGIMSGAATLSVTLGGMLIGYLLVTGLWRPGRLLVRLRTRFGKRRRGLHVVPPRDPTLH